MCDTRLLLDISDILEYLERNIVIVIAWLSLWLNLEILWNL